VSWTAAAPSGAAHVFSTGRGSTGVLRARRGATFPLKSSLIEVIIEKSSEIHCFLGISN
jgi:hypothetical protein